MQSKAPRTKGAWIPAAACLGLIFFSACISYFAAGTKSPAFDEPLHLTGGIASTSMGDFRVNPEDPALFGRIATIPVAISSVPLNVRSASWAGMLENHNDNQWIFTIESLFQSEGIDGQRLVRRSRVIFLVIGACCAGVIAWWAWKLAGPIAAVIATFLYCLDPNFLAHAPLIKNDVASSLLLVATIMATWHFGRRGTLLSFGAIVALIALAVNIKFSGVAFAIVVVMLLFIRALLPEPWLILSLTLARRSQRLLVVPVAAIVIATTAMVAIWSVYRFRFAATPDGRLLNTESVVWNIKASRVMSHLHRNTDIPGSMINATPAGLVASIENFAERNRLLPQAWLYGFLYTYSTTIARQTFFLGRVDSTGVWYYFPFAFIFKTPLATLLMIPLGIAVGVIAWRAKRLAAVFRWVPQGDEDRPPGWAQVVDWWLVTCLGIPPVVYLLSAMSANMNIGLRHILPIYPFLFIILGILTAATIVKWGRRGVICAGVMLAGLAVESLAAYPHFIPFFNAPSRMAGEINLLGDSNLDWGQDLLLLADWQKTHPAQMYISYFGLPDPQSYGIKAQHLPGGWFARKEHQLPIPGQQCYLAVSATALQGIYHDNDTRQMYRPLKNAKPVAILGKSIYIYEWPLR